MKDKKLLERRNQRKNRKTPVTLRFSISVNFNHTNFYRLPFYQEFYELSLYKAMPMSAQKKVIGEKLKKQKLQFFNFLNFVIIVFQKKYLLIFIRYGFYMKFNFLQKPLFFFIFKKCMVFELSRKIKTWMNLIRSEKRIH